MLLAAADSQLRKVSNEARKDFISQETWSLIEERNRKLKRGDPEKEVQNLNRKIKKKYETENGYSWENLMRTPQINTQKTIGKQ